MDDKNPITLFAVTNYRDIRRKFGIKEKNRRGHLLYVVGKTGTGKSTLIQNMVISDINESNGLAMIDPRGDLVAVLSRANSPFIQRIQTKYITRNI